MLLLFINPYRLWIHILRVVCVSIPSVYTSSDVSNDAVDCSADERSTDQICLFPLSNLGDRCTKENQYGYAEGKPCVLLKMNKVRYSVRLSIINRGHLIRWAYVGVSGSTPFLK